MFKTMNPILFQGNLDKKHYFEGWYFKQVTKDENELISFIPGISLNDNDKHCFVQYISVTKDKENHPLIKTDYFRYPLDQFISRDKPFQVQIGPNTFSEDKVSVLLKKEGLTIKGSFRLAHLYPIKKSTLNPTIMGPFSYVPFMECYHGVISMKHHLSGYVKINHRLIDFTEGTGYIEKDWGTSFPKQYLWLQSNTFTNTETSLFFSVADIPFMKAVFEGFICNLLVHQREYRFATYNRSKMSIEQLTSQKIKIVLENTHARLTISAQPSQFGELIAPKKGSMSLPIKEGFSNSIYIKLEDFHTQQTYEDQGKMCGMEIVGYKMEK
ncbi:tocopherol cyclase family protein [Desemzia sp. FAM 23991]|uniref:tocopherol cyclase family protein n=1 Tax=unclassified Desemzia TaxID=2685243 RepID=UPI003884A5D4